ncbi:MAG: NUDIX domain-containing protein [Actinomycetota bacterium]|nr:NUDIX domain-containing protein [Actinomycetota bacterium]
MPLHDDACEVLTAWAPPDDVQANLRRSYLEHLDNHSDAMWRHCQPNHLTASVLIFSSDHSQVLLTLHKVMRRWLQTGGHCESDDLSLAEAALREGREESGIDSLAIDPTPVWLSHHAVPSCGGPARGPIRPSHHLDVQFIAVAPAGAKQVISDESDDLQWFGVDDLPADSDNSVRELTLAGVKRLRESP